MKVLIGRLVVIAVLAAAGMLSGASAAALTPVKDAHAGCENDECDRWFFWERCRDNPGGLTSCAVRGRSCATLACRQTLALE